MKIIKRGNPVDALLEKTCNGHGHTKRGCGSIIRLDAGDVWSFDWRHFDEGGTDRDWVCPVCGAVNRLMETDQLRGTHRKGPVPMDFDWAGQVTEEPRFVGDATQL